MALITAFRTRTLGIGYTSLNEANIAELRAMLWQIEDVFGTFEGVHVKTVWECAAGARKRARILAKEDLTLSDDAEYRDWIDRFKTAQRTAWRALRNKAKVE